MYTVKYFITEQPEIAIYNNKVARLSDMLFDTNRVSKAAFLYDPRNNKRKLSELSNTFSEETIYRAFIVYCKFNSLVPINEKLKAICPTKPDYFNPRDSLEESIRKLKSNGENYNEYSLANLLNVINNSTKQTIEIRDKNITIIEKLREIMEKMDTENLRDSGFRTTFMTVLESFELNSLIDDAETPEIRKLKNILAKINQVLQTQIFDFVRDNSVNIERTDIVKFKEFIVPPEDTRDKTQPDETIIQFKETGDNMFIDAKEETGYKMINFMKNTLRCLTKEYPNIIITGVDKSDVNIPSHWMLSGIHNVDVRNFIKNHYEDLKQFNQDKQISLLMKKLMQVTVDINELAQNTLFYTPIERLDKKSSGGGGTKTVEKGTEKKASTSGSSTSGSSSTSNTDT